MVIRPRNDIVLIRIVNKGQTASGIAVPDISQEGKVYLVEAVGDKVQGIEIGDSVFVLGNRGQTWDYLPGSKDLFIIKQDNIPLVFQKGK